MKTISVVIPVYNEKDRLHKTFAALKKGIPSHGLILKEIIFVNDGSTDGTSHIIRRWIQAQKQNNYSIRLISYRQNKGKGYAIRQGLQASQSDYTLIMDADMSTPLQELKKMVPAIKKSSGIVIGTRKNGKSTVIKHQPRYREILGRGFTYMSNIILNTWVTDFTCGFKIFSRQAAQEISSRASINRWGYDAELIFLATRLSFPIVEIPVAWSHDEGSKVRLSQALPQTLIELITIRYYQITGKYALSPQKLVTRPALQWITTHLL